MESITKEQALEAYAEFSTGSRIINGIHQGLMADSLAEEDEDLGFSEEQVADYLKARKHIEKSIEINPYFPEAYLFLANSYWEIEDDKDSVIKYYTQALDLYPHYEEVLVARGQIYSLLEKRDLALKDLEVLTELDSTFAWALQAELSEE